MTQLLCSLNYECPLLIYCTTMCSWMVFIEIVNSGMTFDNVLMLHLLLHIHKCSKGWVSIFVEAYFSSFMMFDLSLGPAVGIGVHHHKSIGPTTAFSRPDLTTVRPPLTPTHPAKSRDSTAVYLRSID